MRKNTIERKIIENIENYHPVFPEGLKYQTEAED
jgi:hypothetical protein